MVKRIFNTKGKFQLLFQELFEIGENLKTFGEIVK